LHLLWKRRTSRSKLLRVDRFPEDFHFTNKNYQGQVKGNAVMGTEDNEGMTVSQLEFFNANQHYIKDQYNQFVQMFKQMKMEEGIHLNNGSEINSNAVATTIFKYLISQSCILAPGS